VISILKSYQYLDRDVKFSTKLLQDLNATVVSTAVENKDQVSIGFLVNYLQQFFLISQRRVGSRDLTKDQREALIKLLEEKLKESTSQKGVAPVHILGLSQILIRQPGSEAVREALTTSVKSHVRKLNFDELHSSLYALKNSYTSNKQDASLQAKYKQFELDLLAILKESGGKTRNQ